MPEVTIVYWRDIPAQVIVGKGRRGAKVQLTERFEQAIDRCAIPTVTRPQRAAPPPRGWGVGRARPPGPRPRGWKPNMTPRA